MEWITIKSINIEDDLFPENLRKINRPPKKIFAIGNLELLKTYGIAIVGSRACTRYGKKMAFIFANDLCGYGITVVSGMAIGIDSFAHKGALNAKGSTIAVLPSGFNHIYPEENIKLYNDILDNKGLVITEYQEDEEACSQKFRDRNRIVAGIAMGTLVVEGAINSGTNITVKFTKDNGKNIFCIPSNLDSLKSYVPNKLIKEGEFLVTDAQDIIDKYPDLNLKRSLNRFNEDDVFFINNKFNVKSKNNKNNENKKINIINKCSDSVYRQNFNLNIYQKSFILDEVENEKSSSEKSKCNVNKKSAEKLKSSVNKIKNNAEKSKRNVNKTKNSAEKSKCNVNKTKNSTEKEKLKVNIEIPDKYKDIYDLIQKNGMIDINNMARNLNIDVQELNVKLIGMELENLIISLPGGNYSISDF